jgi:hypothetical protein
MNIILSSGLFTEKYDPFSQRKFTCNYNLIKLLNPENIFGKNILILTLDQYLSFNPMTLKETSYIVDSNSELDLQSHIFPDVISAYTEALKENLNITILVDTKDFFNEIVNCNILNKAINIYMIDYCYYIKDLQKYNIKWTNTINKFHNHKQITLHKGTIY